MKRTTIAFLLSLLPMSAGAQTTPDPKSVTSISGAAEICGFDAAGLEWSQQAADVIAIKLTMADIQGATPKMALLKQCFFGWAYDRNVKVEVSLKE